MGGSDSVCPKVSEVPEPGAQGHRDRAKGTFSTAVFTCCLFISLFFFSKSHPPWQVTLGTQRALGTQRDMQEDISAALSCDVVRKTGFTIFSDYRGLLATEPYF